MRRHWLRGALLALAALALAGAVAFRAAVSLLKGRVAEALGPTSEMAALRVGWSGVVIDGLRIPAPRGLAREGRAARRARDDRSDSAQPRRRATPYRIWSVTVARPYLSVLRRPGGSYLALPGLHHDATAEKDAAPGASPGVSFGEIALVDGVLEIFDATVATPPLKIRLEQIEASAARRERAGPARSQPLRTRRRRQGRAGGRPRARRGLDRHRHARLVDRDPAPLGRSGSPPALSDPQGRSGRPRRPLRSRPAVRGARQAPPGAGHDHLHRSCSSIPRAA